MATTEEIIQRLHESKPPVTDAFTYLTIIEQYLSPEILPALSDILNDAELTSEIGWDLVAMLLPLSGSSECLERVARFGNPREVILKVLEVLEVLRLDESVDDDGAAAAGNVEKKITLLGMLGVLHRRLKVKKPSRFIHTTLATVLDAYDPTSPALTAALIDLVRSLSGHKRPPLPTRQSSTRLETPFRDTDMSKTAPDPEASAADLPDSQEERLIERLLQAFVLEALEKLANDGVLGWAGRLVEYTWPERIVPGRETLMQLFKGDQGLQIKDALVGQLVVCF
jgi:hypothetical protein